MSAANAASKSSPCKVRIAALDGDYQFHKDLIDFQKNEIISKHSSTRRGSGYFARAWESRCTHAHGHGRWLNIRNGFGA
jgi:hypothetical protein